MAKSKPSRVVDVHLHLPAELVAALDARVEALASGATWPRPSRTDLIRNLIAEAAAQWSAREHARRGKDE